MSSLTGIVRTCAGRALRYGARHRIRTLRGVSAPLAAALEETLLDALYGEEQVWIESIEALREELCASRSEIEITDYGAGSPQLALSTAQMARGRVVRRTVGEVCLGASKPRFWSLLLFKIIRKFEPRLCLELGTCFGISAAYQAAAMKLNGAGSVVTLEGAPSLAAMATSHLSRLRLENATVVVGRFQETLPVVLGGHGRFDYVFIDGHHDELATVGYFEAISPHLSEHAVVVLDDISWSVGMRRAWETVVQDARVRVAADFRQIGVCLLEPVAAAKRTFSIPLV